MNEGSIIELNRKRAVKAYESMKNWLERKEGVEEKDKKRLKTICRKLPVLISNNGLLTVLTFYKGKKTRKKEGKENARFCAEEEVCRAVEEWLLQSEICEENNISDITAFLLSCTRQEWIILTKEAVEYTIWLKRNAESMILE